MKAWLCALLLAAAWPAAAQVPMVFSKPAATPADKANDFMGSQHTLPSPLNPSSPADKSPVDVDVLPGAPKPQPLSPQQFKQWQKSMDDAKNWTFLTPQQILGIPTPEQIFGLPDPNHEENLSAAECYITRLDRQENFSATNGMRQADNNSWQSDENNSDPFKPKDSDPRRSALDGRPGQPSQNFSRQPLNGKTALQSDNDPNRQADSLWHSAFTVMPPPPKPDPIQVAQMEHLRALMDPPPLDKPAMASGVPAYPGYSSAPAPVPAPDPNMQPMSPSYNPVGRSFTPVQNTAGRPTGLNPLPTITGQTAKPTVTTPKPLVKPPPWLSNEPQLGQMPQRQY